MASFFESIGEFFLEITQSIVIVISILLIVYLFFAQPHQVNGLSMYPMFDNGDYLLTDKISYRTGKPKRGDVVVFRAPESAQCPTGTGCDFIKRMIGLPGETIEVKENGFFINGEKLEEPYVSKENQTFAGVFTSRGSITLGPDEYFVSGDNRLHSSDSRSWGPITSKEIVGKAFFRYWPIKNGGFLVKAHYAF